MEFFDVIRARRSTRVFKAQPLGAEQLRAILAAANQAPSAGNLQAYEVLVVTRRATREALVQAAHGQAFIAQAPLTLAFCAHPGRSSPRYGTRGRDLYCLQDATIACAYAQLAAVALGLASVWVGAFDDDAVQAALGLPAGWRPVALLPIGYAAETPAPQTRRAVEDLARTIA